MRNLCSLAHPFLPLRHETYFCTCQASFPNVLRPRDRSQLLLRPCEDMHRITLSDLAALHDPIRLVILFVSCHGSVCILFYSPSYLDGGTSETHCNSLRRTCSSYWDVVGYVSISSILMFKFRFLTMLRGFSDAISNMIDILLIQDTFT